MKKSLVPVIGLAVVAAALWSAAPSRKYVGASACKLCHKSELQGGQYVIWEESLHAQAFANLKTDKALEIGKSAGVSEPAANAQCLGCHAPLADKAPELKDEGVTCEVCHGPGSAYKKLSVMQDREQAAQNGLVLYDADLGKIEAHCLKCHQNPHGNPYDFRAAWGKIKHPVPPK
jgi:hypothetical protein